MFTRMPFGKFEGHPLHEIPDDYLAWVLGNCTRIGYSLKTAIIQELERRRQECDAAARRYRERQYESDSAPSTDVIARWYRRQCLLLHPDRGGRTCCMQALNNAHQQLKEMVAEVHG